MSASVTPLVNELCKKLTEPKKQRTGDHGGNCKMHSYLNKDHAALNRCIVH